MINKIYEIISVEELGRLRPGTVEERQWIPEVDVAIPAIAYGQTVPPEFSFWEWPPSNWTVSSYTIGNGKHYVISGATVQTENGVVTVDGYCLRESLYLVFPESIGWGRPSDTEISIPQMSCRKVGEAYHSLCGYVGNRNYAHWWVDVVPLLGHQILRRCFGDGVALIPVIRSQYQKHTLALMPDLKGQYLEVGENESITVDKLHFVPSVTGGDYHPQPWNSNFINEIKRRLGLDSITRGNKRIYLSRRDATARRMANEDAICSIASRYGFEIVEASGLTIIDQIQLFAQASHVVSPHGAGLANILFCLPEPASWSCIMTIASTGHCEGWLPPVP